MGFNRRKMEDQRREAAEKEAAIRRATDAQVLEDAERLIAVWNERQALRAPMIFSPTIGAAIRTGYWFLWVRCPAQQRGGRRQLYCYALRLTRCRTNAVPMPRRPKRRSHVQTNELSHPCCCSQQRHANGERHSDGLVFDRIETKDNDVAIATYLRNGFKSTEFEILVAPFAPFAAATKV